MASTLFFDQGAPHTYQKTHTKVIKLATESVAAVSGLLPTLLPLTATILLPLAAVVCVIRRHHVIVLVKCLTNLPVTFQNAAFNQIDDAAF